MDAYTNAEFEELNREFYPDDTTLYDDGFSACVCHEGVMWDVAELSDSGHCPQYFYELEQAEQERAELEEAWAEWQEATYDPDHPPYDRLEEREI